MPRRAAAVAATVSLLLIAVGLAVVGSARERHPLGSNFVTPTAFVAVVPAGERVCQPGSRIPEGTGGIQVRVGTFGRPGPPLELSIEGGGTPVHASLEGGWREGDVAVPLPPLAAERGDARVCVANEGDSRIAVAGGRGQGPGASVDGKTTAMIRLDYLERDRRSWFALADRIGDRVATVRDALPGAATLPLFGLLALVVLVGSVTLVVREARP